MSFGKVKTVGVICGYVWFVVVFFFVCVGDR